MIRRKMLLLFIESILAINYAFGVLNKHGSVWWNRLFYVKRRERISESQYETCHLCFLRAQSLLNIPRGTSEETKKGNKLIEPFAQQQMWYRIETIFPHNRKETATAKESGSLSALVFRTKRRIFTKHSVYYGPGNLPPAWNERILNICKLQRNGLYFHSAVNYPGSSIDAGK